MQMKTILYMSVIILSCVALYMTSFLWFPGVTQKQTASILFNDSKFGVRALKKAKWHGVDLYDEIAALSNDFERLHYGQARLISMYLIDIDLNGINDEGYRLYNKNNIYSKLFGLLILLKLNEKLTDKSEVIDFLRQLVTREYNGLEKNLFETSDYYSELSIILLSMIPENDTTEIISNVLLENNVPYERHRVACKALASLGSSEAITILHKRILDLNYYAILPAYEALKDLGDSQAKEYAQKRLQMMTPGDGDYDLLEKRLD